jgi:CheY-like chemotaxis protein
MRNARILLADDDDDLRTSLATLLSQQGAEVHEASGGQQALQLLAEGEFDLVVTDVLMPSPIGTQLAAMTRTAGASTPILVITAYEDDELDRTVDRLDCTELLPKPFAASTFIQHVRSMLGESTAGSG